jgi:hypothetical protein
MRCDCTGEPPGESMTMATAGAAFTENAFRNSGVAVESVSPEWKRESLPMAPESRTTGTTGPPYPGNQLFNLSISDPNAPLVVSAS